MGFRSVSVNVGASPTLLLEALAGDMDVWLMPGGNVTYFIGGDDVTTSNGLRLSAEDQFHSKVRPGDELWGIVGSGSESIRVLVRNA